MDNVITVAVILGMIAFGVFMIHLLNGGHEERISAFHYSKFLPGPGATHAPGAAPSAQSHGVAATTGGTTARHDQRDGGRGRTRPRGKQVRTRRTARPE
jgi:hypothetical protein